MVTLVYINYNLFSIRLTIAKFEHVLCLQYLSTKDKEKIELKSKLGCALTTHDQYM